MLSTKSGKRRLLLKDKTNLKTKIIPSSNVSTASGVMKMRKFQRFNSHLLLMALKIMRMLSKALINVLNKLLRSFTLTTN